MPAQNIARIILFVIDVRRTNSLRTRHYKKPKFTMYLFKKTCYYIKTLYVDTEQVSLKFTPHIDSFLIVLQFNEVHGESNRLNALWFYYQSNGEEYIHKNGKQY